MTFCLLLWLFEVVFTISMLLLTYFCSDEVTIQLNSGTEVTILSQQEAKVLYWGDP